VEQFPANHSFEQCACQVTTEADLKPTLSISMSIIPRPKETVSNVEHTFARKKYFVCSQRLHPQCACQVTTEADLKPTLSDSVSIIPHPKQTSSNVEHTFANKIYFVCPQRIISSVLAR
jgi:hypothetical protein